MSDSPEDSYYIITLAIVCGGFFVVVVVEAFLNGETENLRKLPHRSLFLYGGVDYDNLLLS